MSARGSAGPHPNALMMTSGRAKLTTDLAGVSHERPDEADH